MNLKEIKKYMNDINGRIAAPQVFKVIEMLVEHLEEQEKSIKRFNLNPAQSAMAIEYRTRRMIMESLDKEIINSTACDCTSIKPFKKKENANIPSCATKFCLGCGQPGNQCICWDEDIEDVVEYLQLDEMSLNQLGRMITINNLAILIRRAFESTETFKSRLINIILREFYPEKKSKFIRFQD